MSPSGSASARLVRFGTLRRPVVVQAVHRREVAGRAEEQAEQREQQRHPPRSAAATVKYWRAAFGRPSRR